MKIINSWKGMKTSFDKCFVLPFLLLNGLSTDLSGGKKTLSNMYICLRSCANHY